MAKAKLDISKLPFLNPFKLPKEFGLKIIGKCMDPMLEDGEFLYVNRDQTIKEGDFVAVFMKPEFVRPGCLQVMVKRLAYRLPRYATFPFSFDKTPGAYGDFGPMVFVEQLHPAKTFPIDLRHVLGIFYASRVPHDVQIVQARAPKVATLKRPVTLEVAA